MTTRSPTLTDAIATEREAHWAEPPTHAEVRAEQAARRAWEARRMRSGVSPFEMYAAASAEKAER